MTHRITTEVDFDAECEHCAQDLVCMECDTTVIEEEFGILSRPEPPSSWLRNKLRIAYEDAIDLGMWDEADRITALIEWGKEDRG